MELKRDKIKMLQSKIAEARDIYKQKKQDLSVKQKETQEAKGNLKKLESDLILTYEHFQALQSDSFRQATPVNRRSVVFHHVSAAASTSSFGRANQQLTLQEASDSTSNIAQRSDREQVLYCELLYSRIMIIIIIVGEPPSSSQTPPNQYGTLSTKWGSFNFCSRIPEKRFTGGSKTSTHYISSARYCKSS